MCQCLTLVTSDGSVDVFQIRNSSLNFLEICVCNCQLLLNIDGIQLSMQRAMVSIKLVFASLVSRWSSELSFLPCKLMENYSSADVLDAGTSSFSLLCLRFKLPIAIRCRGQLVERATGYGRR